MRTEPELCSPDLRVNDMRLRRFLPPLAWTSKAFGSCLILLVLTGCETKEARPEPGPPEVETIDVVQKDVPVYEEWVAQLNGPTNADITPKVQGYLLTQNYENGYFVKKGQLLYTIDPRPFQARRLDCQ